MNKISQINASEAVSEANHDSVMENSRSNIVDFYQNRSVFITGGSGFIGKVLIEKLLRSCESLKHIFILIRPKRGKQPYERIQELLKSALFDQVRAKNLHQKVIVVEGDVTLTNLGLSQENLIRIMNEVSVVYHSAATVKFDEPLKLSVAINISGTKNIVELCRKMPQLVALVHISTAYANCDREEIDEHVYPVDMNPEKLIELAEWLDQETLQELKVKLLAAKPNTYTYTKALAEWLLVKTARDLPVVICRPSIVTASWKEPFGGWIDNFNGPTGVILGTGKGLIRSMFAEPDYVADLVPVDTVINLIIALGWFAYVYRNHKQLNDAAESLTESIVGSDSLYTEGDSFDEYTNRVNLLTEQTIELNCEGNISNARDNDSNNNNNNTHASAYESNATTRARKTSKESKRGTSRNNLAQLVPPCRQLQKSPALSLDDGYGSATHSSDNKSTASSSSPTPSTLRTENEDSTPEDDTSEDINNHNNNDNTGNSNNHSHQPAEENHRFMSLVAQKRLDDQNLAAFEYKLKQFRHNTQEKLATKGLPEEIADIPVFHCTSGSENPITWGKINILIVALLAIYPSITTYRYPCGSFTNKKRLDKFYGITLHYIPAYIVDFVTKLFGSKPQLVKIFQKFDQAASVLMAFTSRQWKFNSNNGLMLIRDIMSAEDRRLFNFDVADLDWPEYLKDYVLGVRKFMLREPLSNLSQARKNLNLVYYRNLSLQVFFSALLVYYLIPFRDSLQLWTS